jgi:putative ABC transport system ATP-binding protein
MAAYARRMVHFVDGRVAKDAANPSPATAAPADMPLAETI